MTYHAVLGLLVVGEQPVGGDEIAHVKRTSRSSYARAAPATPHAAPRRAPVQAQAPRRHHWEAPHSATSPPVQGPRELTAPHGVPPRHRSGQHLLCPLPALVSSVGQQKLIVWESKSSKTSDNGYMEKEVCLRKEKQKPPFLFVGISITCFQQSPRATYLLFFFWIISRSTALTHPLTGHFIHFKTNLVVVLQPLCSKPWTPMLTKPK